MGEETVTYLGEVFWMLQTGAGKNIQDDGEGGRKENKQEDEEYNEKNGKMT